MHIRIENLPAASAANAASTVTVRRIRLSGPDDEAIVSEFILRAGESGLVEVGGEHIATIEETQP